MNLYTLPAEKPFLNTLASWLLAEYGDNISLFTKTLVLLPSRRACRALREAFLVATAGKPTLLPKIQPIGDLEEEELLLHGLGYALPISDIPAAVPALKRIFMLARLVNTFKRANDYPISMEQAIRLAQELAAFLDEMASQSADTSQIEQLVPQELAIHWQQTLGFLQIIFTQWPNMLQEMQALDPPERRNRILRATAAAWRQAPPDTPIIIAGIHTAIPAVAELLLAVASLPKGKVILPALDTVMPEAQWQQLGETHPQYGLKTVLAQLDVARSAVQMFDQNEVPPQTNTARIDMLRAVMQPPIATASWAQAELPFEEGMQGMELMTAESQLDEARMIAVRLREALEVPEKTAALVTPDRMLARMVAAQMRRFDVHIDDSAGIGIQHTVSACFLRLIADFGVAQATPVSLLAVLRHPLAAGGMATAEFRRLTRVLELSVLRGLRHAPGIAPLLQALTRRKESDAALIDMLTRLEHAAAPFLALCAERDAPFSALLDAHLTLAEALAADDLRSGSERLWANDAGNQLAFHLADIRQQAAQLGSVAPDTYPGLLEALLAECIYRPSFGTHPRLHILSPMEARLQQYDLVILGGMNEGVWPAKPEADPWMSRPMRKRFALPAPEADIGEMAHDWYMLSCAKEVVFTRARKTQGSPTVSSRWLVRLETLLAGRNAALHARMKDNPYYTACVTLLDAPEAVIPLAPPMPCPPVKARPRRLRATSIDSWLQDPYVIYAQYILRLRALETLDRAPEAADFGNLIHRALELFIREWPRHLPKQPEQALLNCGRTVFAAYMQWPAVAVLWWPRFEAMVPWIITQEKQRRDTGITVWPEVQGEWTLACDGGDVTITARIDRLEVDPRHIARLIDYKTGMLPGQSDIEEGRAMQLPVGSLVALKGALSPAVPLNGMEQVEYWKLSGSMEQCEVLSFTGGKQPMEVFLQETEARLRALIAHYDRPDAAYAAQSDPSKQLRYNDYEHLTRRQEWETV